MKCERCGQSIVPDDSIQISGGGVTHVACAVIPEAIRLKVLQTDVDRERLAERRLVSSLAAVLERLGS